MKRYRVYGDEMRPDPNGNWVSFTEAEDRINILKDMIEMIFKMVIEAKEES